MINEGCKDLEFYDKYGYLPWQKKKISIAIDRQNYMKLALHKNKSDFVNKLIAMHKGNLS